MLKNKNRQKYWQICKKQNNKTIHNNYYKKLKTNSNKWKLNSKNKLSINLKINKIFKNKSNN